MPQSFPESGNEKDDCTICAAIKAHNKEEIWESVKKHFPDYKERFIEERTDDWTPNDRFPNFDINKTSI